MITSGWINSLPYAVLQQYATQAARDSDADGGVMVGEVETYGLLAGRVIMPKTLEVGSDNDILVERLRLAYADTYVTDAAMTFNVVNEADQPIVSDVSMSYEVGTNGTYRGVLDSTDSELLIPGDWYDVEITATSGTYTKVFRVTRLATYDKGNG